MQSNDSKRIDKRFILLVILLVICYFRRFRVELCRPVVAFVWGSLFHHDRSGGWFIAPLQGLFGVYIVCILVRLSFEFVSFFCRPFAVSLPCRFRVVFEMVG